MHDPTRRRFLATTVTATGLTTLTGCLSEASDNSTTSDTTTTTEQTVRVATALDKPPEDTPTTTTLAEAEDADPDDDYDDDWSEEEAYDHITDAVSDKTGYGSVMGRQDGQLRLEYKTTADTAGQHAEEIGTAAGAYAGALGQGAPLSDLFGYLYFPDETPIGHWLCERDWAEAVLYDEITAQECVERIFDTIVTYD